MATNRDPTPEQIAAICAEIQSTWTAAERLRRLRSDQRPTFTRCDGVRETMAAEDYERHHSERAELQAMEDL